MKMNIRVALFITTLLFIFSIKITAQHKKTPIPFQTIKGIVYDSETQKPIKNVTIFEEKNNYNSFTDDKGAFTFKVATGRKTIVFSHLGYESKISSIFLNASQEHEMVIFLEPSLTSLSEITLQQSLFQKEKTINPFIYSSGRSFSTEEAYRYAGTLGDPARMARAYPGVIPSNDNRNDIVIRGNSPIGLLWRVDGIEIPNPNHFGNVGLTGGTVTLLNPKMMTNSDFISSAFPVEYGNATAGVFDVKLKKGSTKKHEFRVGTGWNGLELAAEGPIYKNNSYIASYRYSFLDIIDEIGLDFGVLPKFQDFTTKLDFDLSEKLTLSVLGLWGISLINIDERETITASNSIGTVVNTGSDTYIGSAKFVYKPSYQTNYIFNISVNSAEYSSKIDEFNTNDNTSLKRIVDTYSLEKKYSVFTQFETYKIKNNHLKIGFRADLFDLDFNQQVIDDKNIKTVAKQNFKKTKFIVRCFATINFRL